MNKLLIAINVVLGVFVVIIFVLLLKTKKQPPEEPSKISLSSSDKTIVYINNDSINEKYLFMLDAKKDLEEKGKQLEKQIGNEYQRRIKIFNDKLEDYNATKYRLTNEQKTKKESELQEEQKNIMQLEQDYSNEMAKETQKMNTVIHDTVTAFLKRFNRNNNYTYILGYTPGLVILYANEKFDITKKVLSGLNEEYKGWGKK